MTRNFGTFIPARDPSVLLPSQVLESFNTQEKQTNKQTMRFGGLVTYEKPIREFFGDILLPVVAAGSVVTLRAGIELPRNCVGVRFLNLVPGVMVNINGGGWRTCLNGDVVSGCEIAQMSVQTDATGTVVIQSVGTGD